VRRIESSLETALTDLPVTISTDGAALPCVARRVTRRGMIVEQRGPAEDFHGFFASVGKHALTAAFDGESAIRFRGAVAATSRSRRRRAGSALEDCGDPASEEKGCCLLTLPLSHSHALTLSPFHSLTNLQVS
jgi:hypothetical protein